jgi:hypothetical protein
MIRIVDHTSGPTPESYGLPPRSVARYQLLAIDQPIKGQATFGTIVTAVYAAVLRELQAKGAKARFVKVERGKFAANRAG